MIIDAHVHIGETEKNDYSYTFDTYLRYMNKNGINKSVVIPSMSKYEKASESNEKLIKEFNKFSQKKSFYIFLLIHPEDYKTFKQIKKEKIHGVKYHPSVARCAIDNISLDPFLEHCEKEKLPVLVHCGRNEVSHIKYLVNVAKNYSKINFIGAHLGGNATDLIQEALELLSKERTNNIYLDTSAGKMPKLIEKAVKILGEDKIIFGSDEPYADLRIEKICIQLTDLSLSVKEKIFYKNILSLLKYDK